MSTARPSFKFRGGSFHALVVKPEIPIDVWLADVDALLARSPGFFAGKSVVIDVSGLSLTKQRFLGLLDELSRRDIRILGVEGADPSNRRWPSSILGERSNRQVRNGGDAGNSISRTGAGELAPDRRSSALGPIDRSPRRRRDDCWFSGLWRGNCRRGLHSRVRNVAREGLGGRLWQPTR